jgi:hypothetical protein
MYSQFAILLDLSKVLEYIDIEDTYNQRNASTRAKGPELWSASISIMNTLLEDMPGS